jgi:spore coat protein CotF
MKLLLYTHTVDKKCFYQLMESPLTVQCRQVDKDLVQKAIEEAKAIYQSTMDRDLTVTIDDTFIAPERWGNPFL